MQLMTYLLRQVDKSVGKLLVLQNVLDTLAGRFKVPAKLSQEGLDGSLVIRHVNSVLYNTPKDVV